MPKDQPAIGVAAFAVDGAGCRSVELRSTPPVRASSVTKPLLAWIAATQAAFSRDAAAWEVLGRAAVTVSDNSALGELWSRAGEGRLLAALNQRVGTRWRIEGDGEHPALRIMVTAAELADAYAQLAADGSDAASHVRRWMREVPPEQAFGLQAVACDTLGVDKDSLGVKCGWFGGERAHAVLIVEAQGRTLGAVVTTNRLPDAVTIAAVRAATGDDYKLAAAHDKAAGDDIRSGARRALLAASEL